MHGVLLRNTGEVNMDSINMESVEIEPEDLQNMSLKGMSCDLLFSIQFHIEASCKRHQAQFEAVLFSIFSWCLCKKV